MQQFNYRKVIQYISTQHFLKMDTSTYITMVFHIIIVGLQSSLSSLDITTNDRL